VLTLPFTVKINVVALYEAAAWAIAKLRGRPAARPRALVEVRRRSAS
jgi:hypothetical protein